MREALAEGLRVVEAGNRLVLDRENRPPMRSLKEQAVLVCSTHHRAGEVGGPGWERLKAQAHNLIDSLVGLDTYEQRARLGRDGSTV